MVEQFAVLDKVCSLLQGLWTIDEDNNPISCGHALQELLGIKQLQNMVFQISNLHFN
jgi:PAS domain-containing protein